MTFAHSAVLSASGSQTAQLTVLVDWFTDPVDSWVTAYGLVEWIHHYNFKEFECRVLCYPVGVKNSQTAAVSASTLLKNEENVYMCASFCFKPNLNLAEKFKIHSYFT